MKADPRRILVVAQKQPDIDDPKPDDLYRFGTVATILQLVKLPDGTVKVLVEGVERARVDELATGDYYSATITVEADVEQYDEREMDVLQRSVISQFEQYVKLNKKVPPEMLTALAGIEQPGRLADAVAAQMTAEAGRKAAGARDPGCAQAPGACAGRHRRRNGCAADRKAHPRPREVADGEIAARVLPQRADEGHPERARRDGGWRQRDQRPGAEDRQGRHAQGGARQGHHRAQQAEDDVADVRRGHGGAQTTSTGW